MGQNHYSFALMPYLPLDSEVVLGNVQFIPIKILMSSKKIDVEKKQQIRKIVSKYRTLNNSTINNPTFVFIDEINFNPIGELQFNTINKAKYALAFCAITQNNDLGAVTSDNFEAIYQNFRPQEDSIATESGSIVRLTVGGYKLKQIRFVKPEYVHIPFKLSMNDNVLHSLHTSLVYNTADPRFKRIQRSFEFFFDAYRNSHEISMHSRILLMLIALEIVLDANNRKEFRDKIQATCTHRKDNGKQRLTPYDILDTRTGNVKENIQLTFKQIWAEEFYKLRHNIIHHNDLPADWSVFQDPRGILKGRQSHFLLAERAYIVTVLQQLRTLGFMKVPDESLVEDNEKLLARDSNIFWNLAEKFLSENIT